MFEQQAVVVIVCAARVSLREATHITTIQVFCTHPLGAILIPLQLWTIGKIWPAQQMQIFPADVLGNPVPKSLLVVVVSKFSGCFSRVFVHPERTALDRLNLDV